jgi:hypothetical protein
MATTGDLAKQKSEVQVTKTVENSIYDIVSQYNGIIDKILEATQPNGLYASRRMNSASTVSYLANVIKGLSQPANHLMFELSLVRDPAIGSLFNMMKYMTKAIDNCPPFQKIDVRVYRYGKPDYQGFNKDLPIEDFDGTIANIKKQRQDLETARKKLHRDTSHIYYSLGEQDKEYKSKILKHLKDKEKELSETIRTVDLDLKEVQNRKREGLTYPSQKWLALKELNAASKTKSEAASAVLPNVGAVPTMPVTNYVSLTKQARDELGVLKSDLMNIRDSAAREDRLLTSEELSSIDAMESRSNKLQQELNNTDLVRIVSTVVGESMASKKRQAELSKKEAQSYLSNIKKLLADLDKLQQEEEHDEEEGEGGPEGAPEGATAPSEAAVEEGLEGVGRPRRHMRGKGKPLADLLGSKMKQQYNYMQRPLTNDDKAHNKSVMMARKWQESVPIHYVDIGSKNPFYSKPEDLKYDFPTRLRYDNNQVHPKTNALGADVSLLQGEIGGPSEYKPMKQSHKKADITNRTPQQALQNILNQDVYKDGMTGGNVGKKGALRKLVFDDESNDLFDNDNGGDKGFIEEDKEDAFKLPDLKKEKQRRAARERR